MIPNSLMNQKMIINNKNVCDEFGSFFKNLILTGLEVCVGI